MLRDPSPKQHALEMVTIEELVPADHLLRKIARHIDFEFIRPATQHLYCADSVEKVRRDFLDRKVSA